MTFRHFRCFNNKIKIQVMIHMQQKSTLVHVKGTVAPPAEAACCFPEDCPTSSERGTQNLYVEERDKKFPSLTLMPARWDGFDGEVGPCLAKSVRFVRSQCYG